MKLTKQSSLLKGEGTFDPKVDPSRAIEAPNFQYAKCFVYTSTTEEGLLPSWDIGLLWGYLKAVRSLLCYVRTELCMKRRESFAEGKQ